MGAPDFSRSSFTSFASIFSVTVDILDSPFLYLFIPARFPQCAGLRVRDDCLAFVKRSRVLRG